MGLAPSGPPPFVVRLRSRRAQRELDALHGPDYRRVGGALRRLAREPRPPACEKLYDDVYRVRVGPWRIIYLVDEENRGIDIGGIRRRTERTYRGIEDLFG